MTRITPTNLHEILRNPAEWTLDRAPIKCHAWDYDDEFGTVRADYLEIDEAPDVLRSVTMSLFVYTEEIDHTDYGWIVPPIHLELVWQPEYMEGDYSETLPEILSDLELVSWHVQIVSKSQISLDITYQYHSEIN